MSIELSDVLVKKFEQEAIQAFQETGVLRNTVRVRDAKGAQQVQFQVIGSGTAEERTAIQTPIPVADISHTPATATVKNYVISEMTDIFLNNQVGFDERQELVQVIAQALGRRLDQVIIDALEAASSANTVADDIGGSADNLNVAMFAESSRILSANGVPPNDRTFLCHYDGYHHFLQEGDVKTADSNFHKPLTDGMQPNFYGFNIVPIGDRTNEGGLSVPSASHRRWFAYQKQAVGLAMNMEPKITIDWEPSYGAHRVTGYMSAGAINIQNAGIVEGTADES